MSTTSHYLTVQEAADRLDVHRETIRRWMREGRIDADTDPTDRRAKRIPEEQIAQIERGER